MFSGVQKETSGVKWVKDLLRLLKQSPQVFCKNRFLKFFQNSQENTCPESFIIGPQLYLKRDSFWHGCFTVNFAKFLRTTFLQNTCKLLFLDCYMSLCICCCFCFLYMNSLKRLKRQFPAGTTGIEIRDSVLFGCLEYIHSVV